MLSGNFTSTSPYTPKAACLNFGMRGRVLDITNHAKFQLDRFRGFGASCGRKSLSPIDWRYRPYNSVRNNVLHCDSKATRTEIKKCGMCKSQLHAQSAFGTSLRVTYLHFL